MTTLSTSNATSGNFVDLRAVLADAIELADETVRPLPMPSGFPDGLTLADWLTASVIRPLRDALGLQDDGSAPELTDRPQPVPHTPELTVSDRVWELTKALTRVRAEPDMPLQVVEATAAVQLLSCQFALADGDDALASRIEQLRAMQSSIPAAIQSERNGPYLVTNISTITDWLGCAVLAAPQLALCRCGSSAMKPYCDGSHADTTFTSHKDPNRVADRRSAVVGQQVTILDNRGLCQHSGYCTDRLATVFHADSDRFITPSGGRMDEIIRATRDCPSGALSFAIDGREAREQVDYNNKREPAIQVSKDGPYRIVGGIPLLNDAGEDEQRNEGASTEHYALCRCGHSQNKPFCSGMHWYVDFKDPVRDRIDGPTVFEWCGGLPALTRMTRLFYEKYVPADSLLAPLFASMSRDHPERVASWFAEVFCGPKFYSEQYGGYTHMISEHVGKNLTDEMRARWVALLLQSAQEAGLPNDAEFRSTFAAYIEWGSRLAVENSQHHARPPANMPMPHWDWYTAAGSPSSRVSALAPPEVEVTEAEVIIPAAGKPVSFEEHIKPLFRERDRQSMMFVFDLWSYADVQEHADAIMARVRNGSMPCDGTWSSEKVDLFQRWISSGKSI